MFTSMASPSLRACLTSKETLIHSFKRSEYDCLRMNENMEFPGISGEDIEWLQDSFVQAIKVIRRLQDSGH